MNKDLVVLDEPLIEFNHSQQLADPHIGLSLFGPYDAGDPAQPRRMSYALIGTENALLKFHQWSEEVMTGRTISFEKDNNLWPTFPGFEAAMHCEWPVIPSKEMSIDENKVLYHSNLNDPYQRTSNVVSDYVEGLAKLNLRDEHYGVVICIIPDEVWRNCRPKSVPVRAFGYRPSKTEIKRRILGQRSILQNDWDPEDYQYSLDFRRQIKARSLQFDMPIQIIRESTLTIGPSDDVTKRKLTPISDRAWNLSTTLYYKGGGKPWRLARAREGVCYIGISFKKTEIGEKSVTACCAAQMFLDSGDGVVFLGEKGPWYSPENKQFHLTYESAKNLLTGVLKKYNDLEGKELKEIFLHSRSEISSDEFEGYREACPHGVKLVGIRVRHDNNIRLYRKGHFPVLRGTFWKLNDREAYLWTTGFKADLRTYDGSQVPIPLHITLMYGDGDLEQISKDIFGLTKLNYNSCKIGTSSPVTILFSDSVGEILISNPKVKNQSPKFKFYI